MDYDYPPQQQVPINPYAQERGLLFFQIDCDDVIETIKHSIMEEVPLPREDGSVVWKNITGVPPLVNQIGMNSILSTLRSRMTKVSATALAKGSFCSTSNTVIPSSFFSFPIISPISWTMFG